MTEVIINNGTKKETIKNMTAGTIFTGNGSNYYMYINPDTIINLPNFTALTFNDFPDVEYTICNAEITIYE